MAPPAAAAGGISLRSSEGNGTNKAPSAVGPDPAGGVGMSGGPLHILLTGAASGLGRGLALHFAARGHGLVLADKDLDGVRETVGLLGATPDRATAHALDVTSAPQVHDLLAAVGDQRIDLLINNAGVQHVARLEDCSEARWELLLDVMLKGTFLMTQAVLPRMRAG